MTRKALIFWVVFWLLGILFGAIAGVSVIYTVRHWKRVNKPEAPQKPRVYAWTPFYYRFEASATNMHTTLPFTEQSEFQAKHNSQGYRTPEYTTGHPPDTFRIVILGDSCSWGQGVKMKETFSYRAGELLRNRCSRFAIEVITLGVCGHRFADHLIKLLVHGPSLRPDLVVIQMYPNDVDFFDYLSIYQFQNHTNPLREYSNKESEVYRENSLDRRVFSEALQEIGKWSRQNKVPVGFLIFPLLSNSRTNSNFNRYDPDNYGSIPQITDFESVVEEIRNSGFPMHYLLDTYRAKAADQYLVVSENDGHPNAAAHSMAADALVNLLVDQKKLVDCATFQPQPADPRWNQEKQLRALAELNWDRFHKRKSPEMLTFYEKLRKIYPQDPWIAMQLGFAYNEHKIWKSAYNSFQELSSIAPAITAPWFHMAENATDFSERTQLLEQMRQVIPDHIGTLMHLSGDYIKQKDFQKACPLLKRQLEIPQTARDYQNSKALYEEHCQ